MFALVELAGRHAQAPEEQQTHTEDGEDAGRSHRTCGTGSRAGLAPGIAPAAGAASISRTNANARRELLQRRAGLLPQGMGETQHRSPSMHPLLVPKLLCSRLALEAGISPANPAIQASHHKKSLNPEFLFFFFLRGYFKEFFLPALSRSRH